MDKFRTFYEKNEESVDKAVTVMAGLAGLAIDVATWYIFAKASLPVKAAILANRLVLSRVIIKEGYVDDAIDTLNWLVS